MGDEVEFSEEQQALVDKLVGQARMKARDQAKEEFEAEMERLKNQKLQQDLEESQEWERLAKERQSEIEKLSSAAERVEAYEDVIGALLKDKLTALGDKAKRLVDALPGGLTDYDKLKWLTDNAELFEEAGVPGTPMKGARKSGDSGKRFSGNPKPRL
jgi:DNA repair exonuclease SbcCD ATPase subunit